MRRAWEDAGRWARRRRYGVFAPWCSPRCVYCSPPPDTGSPWAPCHRCGRTASDSPACSSPGGCWAAGSGPCRGSARRCSPRRRRCTSASTRHGRGRGIRAGTVPFPPCRRSSPCPPYRPCRGPATVSTPWPRTACTWCPRTPTPCPCRPCPHTRSARTPWPPTSWPRSSRPGGCGAVRRRCGRCCAGPSPSYPGSWPGGGPRPPRCPHRPCEVPVRSPWRRCRGRSCCGTP